MRMIKRIAVGVLTAAMALSLLTACGGGEAPAPSENPGNNNSNSSSNENKPEEKPEEKPNKPEEKPDDSLNGLADGTEIAFQNSRSYKFFQLYQNSPKLYMKMEVKNSGQTGIIEGARDGQKSYQKNLKNNKVQSEALVEVLNQTATSYNEIYYELYSTSKVAIRNDYTFQTPSDGSASTTNFTYVVKKTTRVVEGVTYYAEDITETAENGWSENVLCCYDNTGTIVYMITEPNTPSETLVRFLAFTQSIPNTVKMSVPDDWTVYTRINRDGRYYYVDSNGHELSEEEQSKLTQSLQH